MHSVNALPRFDNGRGVVVGEVPAVRGGDAGVFKVGRGKSRVKIHFSTKWHLRDMSALS